MPNKKRVDPEKQRRKAEELAKQFAAHFPLNIRSTDDLKLITNAEEKDKKIEILSKLYSNLAPSRNISNDKGVCFHRLRQAFKDDSFGQIGTAMNQG
jgi:hypothetical protein